MKSILKHKRSFLNTDLSNRCAIGKQMKNQLLSYDKDHHSGWQGQQARVKIGNVPTTTNEPPKYSKTIGMATGRSVFFPVG